MPIPSIHPSPFANNDKAARALRGLVAALEAPDSRRLFRTLDDLRNRLLETGIDGLSYSLAWSCLREACTGSRERDPEHPNALTQWWALAQLHEKSAALGQAALLVEHSPRPRPPSIFARMPRPLAGLRLVRFLDLLTFPMEDSAAWCVLNYLLRPSGARSPRW